MDWGVVGTEAVTGLGLGASIGSLFPGLGTLIGAGVGALAGGIYGLASSDTEDQAQKRLWERRNIMGISQNAPTSLLGRQSGAYAKNKIQHRKTINESALDTINATRQTRDIVNYGAAAGSLVAGGLGATGLLGAGAGAAGSATGAAATIPTTATVGASASGMGPAGTAIMGAVGGSSAPIAATAGVTGNAILTATNTVTPLAIALADLTKTVVPSLVSGVQSLSPDTNTQLTKEKLYADENIQDPDKEDSNKTDINDIYNNIGIKYPSFLEPQQRFDSIMNPKNNSPTNAVLAEGGENTKGTKNVVAGEAGREWLIDSQTGDIIKELDRGAERLSMPEGTAVINQEQKVRLEAGEPLESIINQLPDVKDVTMAAPGAVNYDPPGMVVLGEEPKKKPLASNEDIPYWVVRPGETWADRNARIKNAQKQNMSDFFGDLNAPIIRIYDSEYQTPTERNILYQKEQVRKATAGKGIPYKAEEPQRLPSPPGYGPTPLPGITTPKVTPTVTEPHTNGPRAPMGESITLMQPRSISEAGLLAGSGYYPNKKVYNAKYLPGTEPRTEKDPFTIGANELGLAGNLMNQFLAAVQPRAEEYKVPKVNLGEPVFASAEKINPDNYRDDRDVMSLIQTMRENGMSLASIGPALLQRNQERNRTIAGQNLQVGNQVRMENARIGNEYAMKKAEMDVSHTAQQTEADKQVAMIRGAQDSARMAAGGNSLFSAEQYLSKKDQDKKDEEMRRAVLYNLYHGKS